MKRLLLAILSFYAASAALSQTSYQGHATHFEALGDPYGGCGAPTNMVGSDYFVALNVFNKPNTGPGDFTRPLAGADTVHMGEFKNGKNCGRWMKVTIMEDCVGGSNSGTLGTGFCTGSSFWQNDIYSGATMYMVVADACGDNNGWCRESPYHLDLHTSSLNFFSINNNPVNDMYPTHFNNRKINWEYVEKPNYQGDIKIHFMQNASKWWSSILITNLKNGIHSVEQKVNGNWVKLNMNSDMGQAYLLDPTAQPFIIRVYDANDKLINNGREYTFDFPVSCGGTCANPATEITFQTTDPVTTNIQENNSTQKINFSVFPNPANDFLFVSFSGSAFENPITISNSLGEIVLQQKSENHHNTVNI
ncbi:MAG: hypothetical protein NT150_07430, partial [Bacteroidetes bacterium]|nr:hypothetical protein [Bacteroidota bacterium]